ncbi:MAG: hypothetical protein IJ341_02780 [Bacteroidales bacterium]|nr:hypothetical protein [Bacteroidales bacterium]
MPKVSMELDFAIIVQDENGSHLLENDELMSLTAGGFEFVIDDKEIPFDFEDYCLSESVLDNGNKEKGLWAYTGGEGGFCKSYKLDECYDEDYEKIGISRDMLSAEYLSKVSKINEIFVEWQILNFDEYDITSKNVVLLVQNLAFVDIDSNTRYNVSNDVIRDFNAANIVAKPKVNLNTTPIEEVDYFFYDELSEEFKAVYFNPDSNAGGQFVIQHYPLDFIRDELNEADYYNTPVAEFNVEDFFDCMQCQTKTYLIDVNEPEFAYYLKEYSDPKPDAMGYITETLDLLAFMTNHKEVEIICYPNTPKSFVVSVPFDSCKDEEEQINKWLDDNIPAVCDDWIYISR